MTRIKIFLILTLTPLIINAQYSINNVFEKNYSLLIHTDNNKHTNFQPFFYPDSIENTHINLMQFYQIQLGFEPNDKSFSTFFLAGPAVEAQYKNKLFVNFAGYGGLYMPDKFFPQITDSLNFIPGIGSKSVSNKMISSHLNFVGNITYMPKNFIYFEIGKGKTFLGDGYRSLLLSDNSMPYPYFRAVTEVWKIKYLYQVSQMKGQDYRLSDTYLFNKFVFTQYLSFNIGKRLNFSMFETIIQSSRDSALVKRGLDINYLNPIVFLRSVEYNIGTFDNVLVGFSGHLKIFKTGMLYGQVFIDEFILSHIKSSDEYWDEKYGIQGGIKFYNTLGIENLYIQGEINAVRPFTYSHGYGIGSYTHAHQPLAHPLGSNFIEGLSIIGYKYRNFYAQAKIVYSQYGENDSLGHPLNYGRNPLLAYTTRVSNDDVYWLQGNKTSLKYAELMFAYSKGETYSFTVAYRDVQNTQISTKSLIFMLKVSSPLLFYNRYLDWN